MCEPWPRRTDRHEGGAGTLQDGDTPLNLREDGPPASGGSGIEVQLRKRYPAADGTVEVLCIKPGTCDLRCDGLAMNLLKPKVLPSTD